MRVILIVNPDSGKGECNAKLTAVHSACREVRVGYQVLTIGDAVSVDDIARRVLAEQPDRVLVCGGDGTVTAVGTALLHTGIPLGILPGGTANSIARSIGVPTRLHDAAQFVLSEEPRPFDAVRINDRISLLTSGAGFDSDVIAIADGELKKKFGVLAYVWAAVSQFAQLSATTFEVSVDGESPVAVDGHCLLLANIGHLFGEFDPFVDSRPDDGKVDVAVLTLGHMAEILSLSGRALMGIKPAGERSAFFAGQRVEVRFSRPLRTQIDGESGGETDTMEAEVLPGALQVIRREEQRKPWIQLPAWLESVADDLMGLERKTAELSASTAADAEEPIDDASE